MSGTNDLGEAPWIAWAICRQSFRVRCKDCGAYCKGVDQERPGIDTRYMLLKRSRRDACQC